MPLVSILTAAVAPAPYLEDTWASLQRQILPTGWDWEWIIQEDGRLPGLADRFSDPRVRYEANGGQLGVAMTRNLGLARARGSLLQALDHDDVLLPGALATLVKVFTEHGVGWAVSQADDLLPDGSRKSFPPGLPFGLIQAGWLNRQATANGGNWSVHCAGLMMRTQLVRALGGWAASPVDDDIVLLAGLAEISDGWHEETVTWLYRQHEHQAHRSNQWRQWSEAGRRIGLQRALAAQQCGLTATLPNVHQDPLISVPIGPPAKTSVELGLSQEPTSPVTRNEA